VTRPLIATWLAHLDGQASREVALQAYREAEGKHGVHIYDDHDARVAPGAFKPHMPISEERVRTLTRSWEQFDRALEPLTTSSSSVPVRSAPGRGISGIIISPIGRP
jgi:hypothetical protein